MRRFLRQNKNFRDRRIRQALFRLERYLKPSYPL